MISDDSAKPAPAPAKIGGPPTGAAVKRRARRQFDAWARSYDRSIVQHLLFQPAYRMFMEELYRWRKDDPAPLDLLDVGAGTGSWLAMVAGSPLATGRLIGLDYSASMCGVANGKARSIEGSSVEFVNADSEHLPFADGSFDALTCSHSFHHYPHQAAAVREMRRVLRPGGRLMLIDGFRDNIVGWVLFDVLITHFESTPQDRVFHAPWSLIRTYFEDAGFRGIHQKKTGIWAPICLTVGVVPASSSTAPVHIAAR